jgi:hypothetical protein
MVMGFTSDNRGYDRRTGAQMVARFLEVLITAVLISEMTTIIFLSDIHPGSRLLLDLHASGLPIS